jgi:3-oxoacyl-[acyl-carrier-protein] synthase-1
LRRLFVDGIGAMTSVGTDVGSTMGSLRAGADFFRELEYWGRDGQRVRGAPSDALHDGLPERERVLAMGARALAECAAGTEHEPLPLLLCVDGRSEDVASFVQGISRYSAVAIDSHQSAVFGGGHAAIVGALQHADVLLSSGRARACYVGASDTLLVSRRITQLLRERRLRNAEVSDGCYPGEGSVFLRVVRRPHQHAVYASIPGLGVAEEPAIASGKPVTGIGMARAMRAAMSEAGVDINALDALAADLNGERRRFTELAFALPRLRQRRPEPLHAFCAAESVGEVGAVIGPLSVAWLAFKIGLGATTKPGGLYIGGDAALRGAVYVSRG